MARWKVHIERPDGKAGDEAVIVEDAANEREAGEKAIAQTDPTWTHVVSVKKLPR